jgi:hypothetical protein
MTPAEPATLENPHLARKPVAVLLEHFAATVPWLSDLFGLVQTGVDKTGKNRYPQIYQGGGGRELVNIQPDEQMKGLLFIERDGPSTIKWNDALHLAGTWSHPLAAVAWLNLPKIEDRAYDFSDELAQQFLFEGLLNSPLGAYLEAEQIEQRAAFIFQRYNFPQERQQLLMYPYAGFRIPFVVRECFAVCPTAPTGADGPPNQG